MSCIIPLLPLHPLSLSLPPNPFATPQGVKRIVPLFSDTPGGEAITTETVVVEGEEGW